MSNCCVDCGKPATIKWECGTRLCKSCEEKRFENAGL